MIYIYIVLGLLFAGIIFFFSLGYHIFKNVCLRRNERPNTFDANFSNKHTSDMPTEKIKEAFDFIYTVPTEDIAITSKDGLKLYATVVYAPKEVPPKGVILLFHGYGSNGRRDFCISMPMLHQAGYHLLLVDQRAHGRSEGKYRCYGIKERFDVVSWYEKSQQLFDSSLPVAVMGLSMGGATVLMSSELLDGTANIKCIVADCPFSSPWDAVAHVMSTRHKTPHFPLLHFVNIWCMLLAKINLHKHSSASAVSKAKLPYLLFHGNSDDYVTISHSKEIAMAAGNRASLCIYEGSRHSECSFTDPERYKSELLSFLEKHMK